MVKHKSKGNTMKMSSFRKWLDGKYNGSRHVDDVICRCSRLEEIYGSLDDAYDKNHCTAIEAEFVYTKEDQRLNKPTGHGIKIQGSNYALTHDLLDALRRYVDFRDGNP